MVLRPVVWLGLAYITGEILAWMSPNSTGCIVTVVVSAAAFAGGLQWSKIKYYPGRTLKKKHILKRFFFVLPVFFLCGYANYCTAYFKEQSSDRDLESWIEQCHEGETLATLIGYVSSVEEKKNSWYIYAKKCEGIFVRDILAVALKENWPELNETDLVGNKVIISGNLELFSHPSNEGQYDEWMYFHARGIRARVWADHVSVIPSAHGLFKKNASKLRAWIRKNCEKYVSQDYQGVVVSMVCGDSSMLDADLKDLYQMSGISHILAISGLHISFIGASVKNLMRRLRIRKLFCLLSAIAVMIFYGWFTGMEASAVRAVVMTGMSYAAQIFGRTYDRQTALVAAALIILVPSPLMVTQPGFLLSFTAAGSLMLCPSEKKLCSENSMNDHRSNRYLIKRKILKVLLAPIFVTAGMFPVLAWSFYEVSVYSLLINLAVVPLMSFVYPLMLICSIAGSYLGYGARILGYMIEGILVIFEGLSTLGAKLPGAVLIVGRPSVAQMLLSYIFMAVFVGIYYWYIMSSKSTIHVLILSGGIAAGCLGIVLTVLPDSPDGMTVTMVDVGQGDCFFIQLHDGSNILVDGGSSDEKSMGKYIMLPFLKSRGVRSIDGVFISHLDTDHINGIVEIMELCVQVCDTYGVEPGALGTMAIKRLFFPYSVSGDPAFKPVRELAQQLDIPCYGLKNGDRINIGPSSVHVVWPDIGIDKRESAVSADRNSSSLVFSFSYGNFSMFFTGDVGNTREAEIIKNIQSAHLGKHDVLKVAHHGSEESTSEEFIGYLDPVLSLISCGKNNSYGHPHKELLSRLIKAGSCIYVSAQNGETVISVDRNTVKTVVRTWTGSYNNTKEVFSYNEIQNDQ